MLKKERPLPTMNKYGDRIQGLLVLSSEIGVPPPFQNIDILEVGFLSKKRAKKMQVFLP